MTKEPDKQGEIPPPPAPREPVTLVEHGRMRIDEYRWLHRLDDPRVQAFLRANNEHAEAVLQAAAGELRDRLAEELEALTPLDEGSPGYLAGGYHYRRLFSREREYPVYVRWRTTPPAPKEPILDLNELAHDLPLFVCEGVRVSPGHDRLVFAVDTTGDRTYTLCFKDLTTGKMLPDEIAGVDAPCVWANDNRTLFYTRLEPGTYRPYQVRRHVLGTDPARDPVVYEETDATYRCLLLPTRTRRFVLLNVYANRTEEIHYLDLDHPEGAFQVFCPRSDGHQYEVDDDGERFLVRTNYKAPDFRLCEAPIQPHAGPEAWRELLPGREGRPLYTLAVFRRFVVLTGFRDGMQRLFVFDRQYGVLHEAVFPEPVYHVWLEDNLDPDAACVRVGYTSLKTPVTYYEVDLESRTLSVLQREEVPQYAPDRYVTECRWAEARDGTRVPISIVYRRDALKQGPAPLLLFGYGEYGVNIPVYFDQSRLVLLDRGFVYAMAHVRGGGELGSRWHEAGRRRCKHNTFTDFIDCAEFLVRDGLARRDQLYAESLSAGGLMLGAVVNLRPDLFRGVYASTPFVDLLSTMANPSLPLTSFEYDEWGNPAEREDWEVMRSNSPYDNISRQAYPHLLVTAALHDSQVPCWEPAKWVARLRDHNTADTRILLKTNLHAGHAGFSARRARQYDQAFAYAFLLDLAAKRD